MNSLIPYSGGTKRFSPENVLLHTSVLFVYLFVCLFVEVYCLFVCWGVCLFVWVLVGCVGLFV